MANPYHKKYTLRVLFFHQVVSFVFSEWPVYIAGIPKSWTDANLRDLFAQFGPSSVSVVPSKVRVCVWTAESSEVLCRNPFVMWRHTVRRVQPGKVTNIGFANFVNLFDGQKAIDALNGHVLVPVMNAPHAVK